MNINEIKEAYEQYKVEKDLYERIRLAGFLASKVGELLEELIPKRYSGEFDREKFIEVWNSSRNVPEVARRMGMPYQTVHSKACWLKQSENVNLKRFRKVNKHVDKVLD